MLSTELQDARRKFDDAARITEAELRRLSADAGVTIFALSAAAAAMHKALDGRRLIDRLDVELRGPSAENVELVT